MVTLSEFPIGIAHILRAHLVHPDEQDHRDLQVTKEELEIKEIGAQQVKMENPVNLEGLDLMVNQEKQEIIFTVIVQEMAKGEIGVNKEIRVQQEDLEDLDRLVVKERLVMTL